MSSATDVLREVLEERGRQRCEQFKWLNETREGRLAAVVENDDAPGGVDIAFSLDVPDLTLALKAAHRDPYGQRRLRSAVLAIEDRFDEELEGYLIRRFLAQRVRESAYR